MRKYAKLFDEASAMIERKKYLEKLISKKEKKKRSTCNSFLMRSCSIKPNAMMLREENILARRLNIISVMWGFVMLDLTSVSKKKITLWKTLFITSFAAVISAWMWA